MTESTLHHAADAARPVTATDGVSGVVAPSRPAGILIGYARCSTEKQDLTAQRRILSELGVEDERVRSQAPAWCSQHCGRILHPHMEEKPGRRRSLVSAINYELRRKGTP